MNTLGKRLAFTAVRRATQTARKQRKPGLLPAFGAWLAGLAAFTVLSVETLFVEEHFVFLVARWTSYLTAALAGASMLAFVALFGLACGFMLRWLEDAADARLVARSVSASLWVFAAYMWMGVALLIAWPPAALTVEAIAGDQPLHAALQGEVAFVWIARLRYVALAGFLVFCAWRLSRHVKWPNAVLAVGFGAALVSAVLAVLGALAGALPAVS